MATKHEVAPDWAVALQSEITRSLREQHERQRNQLRDLESEIMRRLNDIDRHVRAAGAEPLPPEQVGTAGGGKLARLGLTTKQHAVMQMLMSGKSNAAIARRMHVQQSTAKVQVRSIARKLGVTNRVQIVAALFQTVRETDPVIYEQISGGLPKDWDARYSDPDPYGHLYRRPDEMDEHDEGED